MLLAILRSYLKNEVKTLRRHETIFFKYCSHCCLLNLAPEPTSIFHSYIYPPLAAMFHLAILFSLAIFSGVASPSPLLPFRYPRTPVPHLEHGNNSSFNIQVGARPYFLVDGLDHTPLKQKLEGCANNYLEVSNFVIGHRGACLQFPEHTRESYMAAARQGAGTIECDVTFTKDKRLVCRHDQCDLHQTTNILATPLADKCTQNFISHDPETGNPASAKCCTTDITYDEFKSLCGKMDGFNPKATTVEEFIAGTPKFRTDLYSTCGTLMSHKDSIEIIDSYGRDFTPEAKEPQIPMPFDGYTQTQFTQAIIDDYKSMNIDPKRVWPQSFLQGDIFYWLEKEPKFGKQGVLLDERVDTKEGYVNATESLAALKKRGVNIIAPPLFALTKLDGDKNIVPSEYAVAAKKVGLEIFGWSFDRSGFLKDGGDYYYQSVKEVINKDSDMYKVLEVLVRDVGIKRLFTDWPATVVYFANCLGLKGQV